MHVPDQPALQVLDRFSVVGWCDLDDRLDLLAEYVRDPLRVDAVCVDLSGHWLRLEREDDSHVLALRHGQRRRTVLMDVLPQQRIDLSGDPALSTSE